MPSFALAATIVSTNLVVAPSAGIPIPAHTRGIMVALSMPVLMDRLSTSTVVELGIELSIHAQPWKPFLLAGWRGGLGEGEPAAMLGGDFLAGYAGELMRLRFQASTPMTIGATLTTS